MARNNGKNCQGWPSWERAEVTAKDAELWREYAHALNTYRHKEAEV